jgi:hypothetical protein
VGRSAILANAHPRCRLLCVRDVVSFLNSAATMESRGPHTAGPHLLLPALLAACTAMGAYLPTMFMTIPGGDSGEVVAEACHLGVRVPDE